MPRMQPPSAVRDMI